MKESKTDQPHSLTQSGFQQQRESQELLKTQLSSTGNTSTKNLTNNLARKKQKSHSKAIDLTLKKQEDQEKSSQPLRDAVKTWLSESTSLSNANVPGAAILFIVARHNMGHLPVSVSVIPSPCFINLPLYGPTEWSCGSLDDGGRGGWVRPKRWPG